MSEEWIDKSITLVRGPSGSGKTTLAKMILDSLGHGMMVSADDYFTRPNGEYHFRKSDLPAAHESCLSAAVIGMQEGKPVIVHNTFTKHWEMEPYYDKAMEYGYEVVEIVCNNTFENVHGVPNRIVQMQRDRFEL